MTQQLSEVIMSSTFTAEMYQIIALVAVLFVIVTKLKSWTSDLQRRADVISAATDVTSDFYVSADKLLSDPTVPAEMKRVLYDVMYFVTEKKAGKTAFDVLVEALKATPTNTDQHWDTLEAFREKNPHEAAEFFATMRDGFSSILLAHGYNDARLSIQFSKAMHDQDRLIRIAKMIEQAVDKLLGGGGKRQSGLAPC